MLAVLIFVILSLFVYAHTKNNNNNNKNGSDIELIDGNENLRLLREEFGSLSLSFLGGG